MAPNYDGHLDGTGRQMAIEPWNDPAVLTYLEQSQQAERERLNRELAQIDDQLTARETIHDDLITELEWYIDKYESELDRLAPPVAASTKNREQVTARLRDLRRQLRNERRQLWQDSAARVSQ